MTLFFYINGYEFALIWNKQGFFIFDSHRRYAERFITSDGYSILMNKGGLFVRTKQLLFVLQNTVHKY